MRALIRIGLALVLLAVVLVGLSYSMLRASGTTTVREGRELASETRDVTAEVTAVHIDGPIDLVLRQGSTPSVKVSGERRMLGNVEVTENGDQLVIGIRGMVLRHRQPLKVTVVLPALTHVSVNGSGDASVSGFSGKDMSITLAGAGDLRFNGRFREYRVDMQGRGDIDLNGGATIDRIDANMTEAGDLTLVGNARILKADLYGSGSLNAEHLRAESVTLTQSGSGDATVQATRDVRVASKGSGDTTVHGNPGERTSSRSGSGTIHFVD